jgi:hypothetical protein
VFIKGINIQSKQEIMVLEWMLSVLVVVNNFDTIAFTTGFLPFYAIYGITKTAANH